MLEKLQDNIGKITPVLSLTAAALTLPSALAVLNSELSEAVIVSLVGYLLHLAACILPVLPKQNLRAMVPVANAVFYGSLAFRQIYSALEGSLSAYAMAALYGAVAVLVFIPACRKAYQLTSLIAIAFFLASALGGGAVNLSLLLFSLLLAANHHFHTKKES